MFGGCHNNLVYTHVNASLYTGSSQLQHPQYPYMTLLVKEEIPISDGNSYLMGGQQWCNWFPVHTTREKLLFQLEFQQIFSYWKIIKTYLITLKKTRQAQDVYVCNKCAFSILLYTSYHRHSDD